MNRMSDKKFAGLILELYRKRLEKNYTNSHIFSLPLWEDKKYWRYWVDKFVRAGVLSYLSKNESLCIVLPKNKLPQTVLKLRKIKEGGLKAIS